MAIWEFGINKPAVKLQNRFLVEKLLGAGGLGETYRAFDQTMERRVVLKVLNAEQQANADARLRFKKEAKMLAKFKHPGVVTVHDLIEVDERDVIVMESIDGYDLLAYMRSTDRWRLPEAEALSYVDQAGEALEYVHQQGLLHRDIKPQNIMRCADGRVKLIDFGLAKQFDPHMAYTNTGGLTEGYAPIEQYEQRGKFTNALDVKENSDGLITSLPRVGKANQASWLRARIAARTSIHDREPATTALWHDRSRPSSHHSQPHEPLEC